MIRLSGAVLGTAVLMLGAAPSEAHHSTAMYDYKKEVTLKGTARRLLWTNPHSYLQLLVPNARGEMTEWSIEIGTPALNIRKGWTKHSVKAGDKVTVEITPLKDGTSGGTLNKITLPNGQVLNGVAPSFAAPGS